MFITEFEQLLQLFQALWETENASNRVDLARQQSEKQDGKTGRPLLRKKPNGMYVCMRTVVERETKIDCGKE